MITSNQLLLIMPAARPRATLFLGFLNAAMDEFEINTLPRQAAFLAQIAHESAQLTCVEENLNYGTNGLMKTWPRRFQTLDIASQYERKPQMIANRVYADRMGNGDEASGDGWAHRGAGLIQVTGADNQNRCADYFGKPRASIGDWLRTPEGACRSAAWFWRGAGCNAYADAMDFDAVSDAINIGRQTEKEGDAIGYADRLAFYETAKKVLS